MRRRRERFWSLCFNYPKNGEDVEGCSIRLDGLLFCLFGKNVRLNICPIQFLILFLCRIWYEMTEDQNRLLAVFEVRVRDLIALCEQQKREIDELNGLLRTRDEELRIAKETIGSLNAKCDNLLMARVFSTNEEEMRNVKLRLSRLVREVDKCIALLNE